jgi:hypothetical protein
MRFSLLLVLLTCGLGGCYGKTIDVGSREGTPAPAPSSSSPASPAPSSTGAPGQAVAPISVPVSHGSPYDAAVAAGAKAACAGPHGPLDPFTTVGDVKGRLVGSWFFCSTTDTQGYDKMTSIEFAPDGHWYLLEDDGHGGLVRGQGIDHEGTYDVSDDSNSAWADASADAPSQGFVGRMDGPGMIPDFVQFEAGPRRMKISVGTAGWDEWFVYIGPSVPSGAQ